MALDSKHLSDLRDEALHCANVFAELGSLAWSRHDEDAFVAVSALASTINRLSHLLSGARQTMNALQSLIFHLPDDVLLLIFRELAWRDPPENASREVARAGGWMVVLWVCVRWRRLVEGDHAIWASTFSQVPSQRLLFLRRAAGSMTTFEISPCVPKFQGSIKHSASILYGMLLQSDFRTCGTIILEDRGDVISYLRHIIHLARDGDLPVLQELRVGVANSTDHRLVRFCRESTGFQAVTISIPKLKTLSLTNIFLPVEAEALESLHLRRVHCSAVSAVPRLQTVIRTLIRPHCHTLRDIEVSRAFKLDGTTRTLDPVALPALRSLCINGDLTSVLALLQAIHFKNGVTMRLIVDLEYTHVNPTVLENAWQMLSSLCDKKSNTLHIRYRDFQRTKDQANVLLLSDMVDFDMHAEAVTSSTPRARPTTPTFSLRVRWNGAFDWWILLRTVGRALASKLLVQTVVLDVPRYYWLPHPDLPWITVVKEVADAFPDITAISPREDLMAVVERRLSKKHWLYKGLEMMLSITYRT
ncbi:unnamed protein product [Peniophora sp. CBMAI 1063]|nr:unnamed protein product [Peniophora sp. CBMAI 1063]